MCAVTNLVLDNLVQVIAWRWLGFVNNEKRVRKEREKKFWGPCIFYQNVWGLGGGLAGTPARLVHQPDDPRVETGGEVGGGVGVKRS